MKNCRFICFLLVIFALFISTSSILEASQNFEFYYQTIEKVEDIRAGGFWDNVKGTIGKLSGSNYTSTGRQKVYSNTDKNLVYTINRVKINSRQELINAIGVPESQMTQAQKNLLSAYDAAKTQAVDDLSKLSYRKKVSVVLTDTSDTHLTYKDKAGNSHTISHGDSTLKKDFWSWSSGEVISLSAESNASAKTLVHEYAHSVDKPKLESGAYGPDGKHYATEMSKPKAAFAEGWAEYNEMIAYKDRADYYKSLKSKKICIEYTAAQAKKLNLDPAQKGKTWFQSPYGSSIYVYKDAKDLTAEQLWNCENYNCNALYEIANGIDNGKEKINSAFLGVRGKSGNIRTLIKELCAKNPNDIAKIGKILDNLTYGKMTNKELQEFIGDSVQAQAYLISRRTNGSNDCPNSSDDGSNTTTTGGVYGTIGNIGSTIGNIGSGIASTTRRIGTGIASTTRIIGSRIASTTRRIGTGIASTTRRIGTGIASITRNIGSRIASATRRIGAGTASATESIGNTIGNAIDSIGNAISNFIEKVKEVYNEVKEVVKNTVNKVVDFFKNLFKKQSDNEVIKEDKDKNADENKETDTITNIDTIDNKEGNIFNIR